MPELDYFILGEGPVILFLHGWGQNKEMMYPISENLFKKYKCVFIDMPGFGNSEYNNEKNIDEYCTRIHDFLLFKLHLTPKYVIGHSFGGKVGVHYYLKYGKIKGITLIASPLLKPKRGLKYYFKVYLYKLKKLLRIKNYMGSNDYKNTKDEMKGFFISVVNTHYNKRLKEIKIPLLLIYSKEDCKVEYKKAKRINKKVRKSRLRVIKGDHFAYLDNRNIVSMEINNFIKENEKKREYYL